MSEYREMRGREIEEADKIDIMDLVQDIYQGIRKFWWLVIGLAVIFATQSYFSAKASYYPNYVASATMSVRVAGETGFVDAQSVKQMETVFPYILTSGVLQEVIAEDMGLSHMPGTVTGFCGRERNKFV